MADLVFYDRSRVTLDWKCPRARYWGNEWQGLGIVPAKRALYFDIGDAYHKAVAALKMGEDTDEVVNDNVPPFRDALAANGMIAEKVEEQATLVEGLIRAYARHVLPALVREYRVLDVEAEFTMDHDGCRQGVKPDSLVERLSDGTLWYWEEKTTGWVGERWFQQWPRNIQLHSTAEAVERHLGREVSGVIVQGAYKGYEREGKQSSILCYGYQRPGLTAGPEVLYEYRAGSRRVPVWELSGGIRQWVGCMPNEVLSTLFVQTPPIFLQRRLVEAFRRQVALRERQIRDACELTNTGDQEEMRTLLDNVFPQHFSECAPAIGNPCAYADLCYNPFAEEDPLRHGYTWRQPHHGTDEEGLRRYRQLTGEAYPAETGATIIFGEVEE